MPTGKLSSTRSKCGNTKSYNYIVIRSVLIIWVALFYKVGRTTELITTEPLLREMSD